MLYPFHPTVLGSVSRAVTSTTARVALPTTSGTSIRLSTSATDADCFIEFGTSAVDATVANSMHFPAGTVEVVTIPAVITHVAAITSSGTATLYAARGEGG